MITDEKRREVAKKLREQAESSCFTLMQWWDHLQLTVMGKVYLTAPEKVYLAIADLIDRPMCHDLVEHKQDPFIPGKRMVDGYFHCSNCGWDGRLWEHIGFGDMLAYEPIHCPKCGARIERRV